MFKMHLCLCLHSRVGMLGVMYCDLFEREGKPVGAAHYNIQTGREVRDEDGVFSHYQNPIIVLVSFLFMGVWVGWLIGWVLGSGWI